MKSETNTLYISYGTISNVKINQKKWSLKIENEKGYEYGSKMGYEEGTWIPIMDHPSVIASTWGYPKLGEKVAILHTSPNRPETGMAKLIQSDNPDLQNVTIKEIWLKNILSAV